MTKSKDVSQIEYEKKCSAVHQILVNKAPIGLHADVIARHLNPTFSSKIITRVLNTLLSRGLVWTENEAWFALASGATHSKPGHRETDELAVVTVARRMLFTILAEGCIQGTDEDDPEKQGGCDYTRLYRAARDLCVALDYDPEIIKSFLDGAVRDIFEVANAFGFE